MPVAAGKQPGVGLPLPSSEFPLLESSIDVAVEGVWNMAPNTRARSSRQRRTGVDIGSMNREFARRPWVTDKHHNAVDKLLSTAPHFADRMFPEQYAIKRILPAAWSVQ